MLLKAQLNAIDELRRQHRPGEPFAADTPGRQRKRYSISQTDMAYEVLKQAGRPLHVREIIQHIQATFGVTVSRDALVSAILKKAAQGRQFVKVGKSTYAPRSEEPP